MAQKQIFTRYLLLTLLWGLSLLPGVVSAQGPSPIKPPTLDPDVELVISGPATMPLFVKGRAEKFNAVLINRSPKPVVFVPPHPEWPEEVWTTWDATDAKGRSVSRLPQYEIFCIGTTMYQKTIFAPTMIDPKHPKTIEDRDLVILQPGEKFELPGIAAPSLYVSFPKRTTYQVTLGYEFNPEHYVMAGGSQKAALLKNAPAISVTSNALTLTLE